MKATIKFEGVTVIPAVLPHAEGEEYDDIMGDYCAERADGTLALGSRCGETVFPAWAWSGSTLSGYRVSPCEASYEGAWRALNAVWGVQFPKCKVVDIVSTKGRFSSLGEYEAAPAVQDSAMPPMVTSSRFRIEYVLGQEHRVACKYAVFTSSRTPDRIIVDGVVHPFCGRQYDGPTGREFACYGDAEFPEYLVDLGE